MPASRRCCAALPPQARLRLPEPTGSVSVESLSVRAPGREAPVLRQLSFRLDPGSVMGVIGPTAAGKSSLARALVGVWPAAAGAVRLDGSDLSHWDEDQLGRHIGYLPQDVELFSGTIAENIARFTASEPDAVVAAAKLAGVHAMIQQMPEGYNTEIGEAGVALSGAAPAHRPCPRGVWPAGADRADEPTRASTPPARPLWPRR